MDARLQRDGYIHWNYEEEPIRTAMEDGCMLNPSEVSRGAGQRERGNMLDAGKPAEKMGGEDNWLREVCGPNRPSVGCRSHLLPSFMHHPASAPFVLLMAPHHRCVHDHLTGRSPRTIIDFSHDLLTFINLFALFPLSPHLNP